MFDHNKFDKMPKYEEFENCWFIPNVNSVTIINQADVDETDTERHSSFGTFKVEDGMLVITAEDAERLGSEFVGTMLQEWDKFKQRPEYRLLFTCDSDSFPDTPVDTYETLFVGAVFTREFRTGHNPDNCWKRLDKCLTWLRNTDFYTCPASTQYHDSVPSGLLEHSINVATRAADLLKCSAFDTVPVDDAVFVALVHDWCKIGLYVPYMKNVKDDATGQWSQVPAYRYAENRTICLGHGVSSLYMVMKFFNVSIEVASAIRHHMGLWNCPDPEVNELQQANRQFPLVHLIQFADQLSIVNY